MMAPIVSSGSHPSDGRAGDVARVVPPGPDPRPGYRHRERSRPGRPALAPHRRLVEVNQMVVRWPEWTIPWDGAWGRIVAPLERSSGEAIYSPNRGTR